MAAEGGLPILRVDSRAAQILGEIAMIGAAIAVYFGVRGLISTRIDLAFRNAADIVTWERQAGVFVEPQLQAILAGHGWAAKLVSYVYIYGHWPVVLATLGWLLLRHRDSYRIFRNAMLFSGCAGIAVFALYPVAPPRFLPAYGFVDTVTEQTSAYRVLQPPMFVNQYAAVPSLHFGWNLLMGIALASLAGHWTVPTSRLGDAGSDARGHRADRKPLPVRRIGRRRRGRDRAAGCPALGRPPIPAVAS